MRRSLLLTLVAILLIATLTAGCGRLRDRIQPGSATENPAGVSTNESTDGGTSGGAGSTILSPTYTPTLAPNQPAATTGPNQPAATTGPNQPAATTAPAQPSATPVPPQPTTDPAIIALEDSLLSGFDRLATQNAEADDLADTDTIVGP